MIGACLIWNVRKLNWGPGLFGLAMGIALLVDVIIVVSLLGLLVG